MQDHFREFDFDVVLGPEFKQDQVYQNVGAPLVDVSTPFYFLHTIFYIKNTI